jgi:hypothetical protein
MREILHNYEHSVPVEHEPRHHLVIANEFVRGFAVEIEPHDRTLCHHHAQEYLIYVAGDAQILSAPRDGDPKTHSYRDGDCELSPPGLVHVVENLRDAKFRNLLVELLPGAQGLPRGPGPKISFADAPSLSPAAGQKVGDAPGTGNVNITNRFANERVAVFVLEMGSGSQVEVFGPAIVASPYEHKVELAPSRASGHTLARFTDLSWLDSSSAAILRNRARTAAKIVLIAVGQK